MNDRTRGTRGTRGAVYVEFLIAFMPLCVFFLSLCQLAYLYAANIVVQHATVMAVRAAVVVLPDDPRYYRGDQVGVVGGERLKDIRRAAAVPLRAIQPSPDFDLAFPLGETVEADSRVQVRVELTYRCRVPIGNLIACGGATKKLSGTAALPNQGAHFVYVEGD